MLDLCLKNATIVDGTGAQRRFGAVGVHGGRIVAIGTIDDQALRTVDLEGQVVCPGFVDVHTHYDAQLFWDPILSPSPFHGVTTVVAGNCGFSIAPLLPSAGPYLMSMLARVEGMPLKSLELGVPWDWESSSEYFNRAAKGLAINAGFMVGHSALRRVVMGEAATERVATDEEIEAMCRLLELGLGSGGMGFSSTTSETHSDAFGRPVPSRFADRRELISLSKICGRYPGTSIEFLPDGAPSPTRSISDDMAELMVALSVSARRPLNWNVIVASEASLPGWMDKLAVSDRAKAEGGKIVALAMPLELHARFSFGSGFSLDLFDGWNELMAAPKPKRIAAFRDLERRKTLKELAAKTPGRSAMADWGSHTIAETFTQSVKRFEGMTVARAAEELGMTPFDALVEISLQDDLRTTFTRQSAPLTDGDWNARLAVWKDPRVVLGASDAGAHLDMASTFRYTTAFLQESVREKQYFGLEEAVHMLTEAPARLYGLRDRGVLKVGGWADLVVFDPDSVSPGTVHTRFDLPGGAGRLYAEAEGIDRVLVAGREVVTHGRATGEFPGGLLRSGTDSDTPQM